MKALRFMDDKILLRIDSLLNHINQVLSDTEGISLEELIIKSDMLFSGTNRRNDESIRTKTFIKIS